MTFHVGQKVVCVNISPRPGVRGLHPQHGDEVTPWKGHVYTVRAVFDARPHGYDQDALLLEEIVNPVRRYIAPAGVVEVEQFFLVFRFRPVRTTSIEVFTRMLVPTPAREVEPVG